MTDPFAVAAAAVFRAPGSSAAIYAVGDGRTVSVRAIRSTSPVDIVVGSRIVEAGATLIHLQCADFAAAGFTPAAGGTVTITGGVWKILARPRLDVEGVAWTCEAAEA